MVLEFLDSCAEAEAEEEVGQRIQIHASVGANTGRKTELSKFNAGMEGGR